MENTLHLEQFRRILIVRICFLGSVPNLLCCSIEKKIFSNVICHGINEPWHDHIIFSILDFELFICLVRFGSNSIEMIVFALSAYEHHYGMGPLEIVVPIQFVSCNGHEVTICTTVAGSHGFLIGGDLGNGSNWITFAVFGHMRELGFKECSDIILMWKEKKTLHSTILNTDYKGMDRLENLLRTYIHYPSRHPTSYLWSNIITLNRIPKNTRINNTWKKKRK